MKITVTQEDIDKGTPKSACSCPVALAIKRDCNLENLLQVAVDCDSISIKERLFLTPDSVVRFIDLFDNGILQYKPFSFYLE